MTTPFESVDSWCRALFDEILFRAANEVSRNGAGDGSPVPVTLPVTVSADATAKELILTLDSLPDGPVALRLDWPLSEPAGQ